MNEPCKACRGTGDSGHCVWCGGTGMVIATAWQPIETAPKDGKRFLAASRFMGQRVVDLIRWDCGRWEGAQGEQRFDAWMPLPEPPK